MARLAARLGAGLSADSMALDLEGDALTATRPVYSGKLLAEDELGEEALARHPPAQRVPPG